MQKSKWPIRIFHFSFFIFHFSLIGLLVLSGCALMTHNIPRIGTGGYYNEAREQFLKGRGGDMNKAIADLEPIVAKEPTYKDSLTLLARAYYNQGRYKDAYGMVRFALGVNKEDEIAWTVLGLTQLRVGEDERGIETLKGAITLVSKVSKVGYRDFEEWDSKGLIRSTISRTAFLLQKGLEEKENILRGCETLLARMDEEEHYWIIAAPLHRRYNTY